MPKISVIMPVYNSAEYLPMAIESVLNQTLKEIELLLIDDGSKDNSGEICDEFQRRDSRIRVFHQQNAGISKTRNRGVLEAAGEYISFIDNDDIYLTEVLEKNYALAKKHDAGIVKYGYKVEETFSNGLCETRDSNAKETLIIMKEDYGKRYPEVKASGYFNMIWNGIYKRELFQNKNLLFNEDIIMGYEDWAFNNMIYLQPECQIVNREIGYVHYQRVEHSTSKKFHTNQIGACVYAAECEFKLIHEMCEQYKIEYKWSQRAAEYLIEILLLFQRKGCDISNKDKKDWLKSIRHNNIFQVWKDIHQLNALPLTKRLPAKLFIQKRFGLLLASAEIYGKVIMLKKNVKKK